MITPQQVAELAGIQPRKYPVTTLFLTLDGGRDKRKAEIQLKDLIKRQRAELEARRLSRDELASVEQDFAALGRFLPHFDRKGPRAGAGFTSSGAGPRQVR